MKRSKVFLIFASLLLIFFRSFASDEDSTVIRLRMPKNRIDNKKDLLLSIDVSLQKGEMLKIPFEMWGYMGGDFNFFSIQLQREINGKFEDMSGNTHIDPIPTVRIDTIYLGHSQTFEQQITQLFRCIKGKYRVRVLVRYSQYNYMNDKYSNWVYFMCPREFNALTKE